MKPIHHFTVDQLRKHFTYDHETGAVCWVGKGKRRPAGVECGTVGRDGYRRVRIQGKTVACHRIAWALHHGELPKREIDHINRNRSDNRSVNLRLATGSQNCWNRAPNSPHGLVGVTPLPSGRWQAQARINGQDKYLGTYSTKELAHQAYLDYVQPRRGEFMPQELQP